MPETYEGILHGNRIDWTTDRPASKKSVRVQVTVVDEETEALRRGIRMAAALSKLAENGGIGSIRKVLTWRAAKLQPWTD
jgi:hypothetical protein